MFYIWKPHSVFWDAFSWISQLNWDFMGNAKAIKDLFGAIKIIADPHEVIFPGGGLGFCYIYYIYLQPLGLQGRHEKMKERLLKMSA